MKKVRNLLIAFIVVILLVFVGTNAVVVGTTKGNIKAKACTFQCGFSKKEMTALKDYNADCILVLGAAVNPDGTPSKMLRDRLDVGLALYKAGVAKKLLLSGDNGSVEYNEVKAMKNYMVSHGVKGEDIFLDHAGFSTYESMYRAKAIFDCRRLIVVTQTYHQYRAIYGAEGRGIETVGVSADQQRYRGQLVRDWREFLARTKDFFLRLAQTKPTFLGEKIPITGNGKTTW